MGPVRDGHWVGERSAGARAVGLSSPPRQTSAEGEREVGWPGARSGQTAEPVGNTLRTKTRAHFAAEEMASL